MKKTDEDAFVAFVVSASPKLLSSAWFLCGDAHAAEELVQVALEKVYVAWRRIERGRELAYARRTLLNEHIDTRRKRAREHLTAEPPESPSRGGPEEDTAFLIAALSRLAARERQVVVMRYYADLSEIEVADLLGVSVGTVKSSSSRGLAHLREALTAEGGRHD